MPRTVKANNWAFEGKEVRSLSDMPKNVLGFVYRLTNHTTGMYYVGRKTVAGNKKKKLTAAEKKMSGNERKTFKYEYHESSGWKNYVGSNLVLKAEAKLGHHITKEILTYCFTKAQLTLEETREIICGGALEDCNSYNGWISCKIYKQHLLK